jgi:small multidrug resistance family-3 protein
MRSLLLFFLAALCEIGGCFAFWAWLRLNKSPLYLAPGTLALVAFAVLLTKIDSPFAARAYAAYGGIYIATSLLWLAGVERTTPDRYDLLGAVICLAGASITLFARRPI